MAPAVAGAWPLAPPPGALVEQSAGSSGRQDPPRPPGQSLHELGARLATASMVTGFAGNVMMIRHGSAAAPLPVTWVTWYFLANWLDQATGRHVLPQDGPIRDALAFGVPGYVAVDSAYYLARNRALMAAGPLLPHPLQPARAPRWLPESVRQPVNRKLGALQDARAVLYRKLPHRIKGPAAAAAIRPLVNVSVGAFLGASLLHLGGFLRDHQPGDVLTTREGRGGLLTAAGAASLMTALAAHRSRWAPAGWLGWSSLWMAGEANARL